MGRWIWQLLCKQQARLLVQQAVAREDEIEDAVGQGGFRSDMRQVVRHPAEDRVVAAE